MPTLFSDNPTPSLLVVEQSSTPTSPASGNQRVFGKDTDHRLKRVDHGGQVIDIEGQIYTTATQAASPSNDTWWIFRDGASPEAVELRLRIGGVTYSISLGSV